MVVGSMCSTPLMNSSVKFLLTEKTMKIKIENGVEYHQALREVSEGLNHSLDRESMTLWGLGYLQAQGLCLLMVYYLLCEALDSSSSVKVKYFPFNDTYPSFFSK